MRVFPVCLAVCLVALLGLWVPSWAEAANYFVESVPVYQLDILDDQDPDTFSYAVDCLLTTSTTELSVAVANSWTNKGIVCYVSPVQAPGTIPLYRLHNPAASDHLSTSSWDERQRAIGLGYAVEGVVGYVYPRDSAVTGMASLHRFYAGGSGSFHMYTLDPAQYGGNTYEGVDSLVWSSKTRITSISLTAPKPGEVLKGASQYDISWNSSTRGGYACVNYSPDGGTTWQPVEYGIENKGAFTWTVPNVATQHGRLQIVWTDALFGQTNLLGIAESALDFKIAPVKLAIPRRRVAMTTAKLPSPSGLTAKTTSTSTIMLSWKTVPGDVKGYILERRSGEGPFLQIAHLRASELTYTDDGLTPGTRYEYRVRAYGPGLSSANSLQAVANTAASLKLLGNKGNGPVPPKLQIRTRTAQ
ncbi:MAG TPA: fibronectin type III domain-containing protein [Anaerolineae bacterium]|nr:fibronectin type III domain-containing protein [Anaerolineae bacterium]